MVIGSVYSSFTPQPVIHIHSFTTLCFFHTLLAYPQRAIISNKSQMNESTKFGAILWTAGITPAIILLFINPSAAAGYVAGAVAAGLALSAWHGRVHR